MHEITYFVKLKQKRCFVKTKLSQSNMPDNVYLGESLYNQNLNSNSDVNIVLKM